jgi:hypothetical protein
VVPSAISTGPASVSHQFGKVVRWRSRTEGKRRPNHSWALWSKKSPVGAASWCAITTSVRSAVGSPASATTFCVGFGRCTARRATRGPFETSSAIAAAAARAMAAAGIRARGLVSAATPDAPAAAQSAPISGAYPSRKVVSSTRAFRAPATPSRATIHSAASRSPADPARRSSGASASTTSRSVASVATAAAYAPAARIQGSG